MKKVQQFFRFIFMVMIFALSLACNTERRDDQGEYSEDDNEMENEQDTVEEKYNY